MQRLNARPRVGRIALAFGGTGRAALELRHDVLPADVVVAADVAGVMPAPPASGSRLVQICLGQGHTLASLCDSVERAWPELAALTAALRVVPTDLHRGAAQIRAIGLLLARQFVLDGGK